MKIAGDFDRTCCPVCRSTSIIERYWRIPVLRLQESAVLDGIAIHHVPTLNAPDLYSYDRCLQCEAVYRNPIDSFQGHSDEHAAKRVKKDLPHGSQARYDFAAPYLPDGQTIIDAACGMGTLLDVASQYPQWKHRIGLDICKTYIEHVKSQGHEGYVVDLPQVPDVHADAIFFSEAFEHVKSPHDVLRSLLRTLNTNGILFFSAESLGDPIEIRQTETIFVTEKSINRLCQLLGVKILHVQHQVGRFLVVTQKETS